MNHSIRSAASSTQCNSFTTSCGGSILIPHHARLHLDAHPEVIAILPEAINRINLPKHSFLNIEIDLGRVLGYDTKIPTPVCSVDEELTFAARNGRAYPTRVVSGDVPKVETSSIVVIAKPSKHVPNTYVLITSWLGKLARKEPWDPNITTVQEFNECLEFWCSHALIYDPNVMGEILRSSWKAVLESVDPPSPLLRSMIEKAFTPQDRSAAGGPPVSHKDAQTHLVM